MKDVENCWRQLSPHDDAIKWKHFPRCWPFVRGIHRSPVYSPHKRPVTRSFLVFFDLRLNKRLQKQSRHRWCDTPSRSLWRHWKNNLPHPPELLHLRLFYKSQNYFLEENPSCVTKRFHFGIVIWAYIDSLGIRFVIWVLTHWCRDKKYCISPMALLSHNELTN